MRNGNNPAGSSGLERLMKPHGAMGRREFLQLSSLALAALALPDISGCSSIKEKQIPELDYSGQVLINNCSVVDVVRMAVRENRCLRIIKGRIHSEEPALKNPGTLGPVIDAGGRFVSPGLIDAHCHMTLQSCGFFRLKDLSLYARQLRNNFTMQIEAGVTTVRDMGSFPLYLHKFLKEIDNGSLRGPRVIFCNSIANIDGGHPDVKPTDLSVMGPMAIPFLGPLTFDYTDMKDLKDKLAHNIRNGASFVKITVDDRSLLCGRGDIPRYGDDELKEIFRFAESAGKPVAAHNIMIYGFKRMLRYPVHSLEHVVGNAYIDDRDIAAMARKDTSIVPTLIVGHNFAFREKYDSLPAEFGSEDIRRELEIKYQYLNSGMVAPFDPHLHRMNMKLLEWFKDPGCEKMPVEKKFMTDPDVGFGILKFGIANLKKMRDAGMLIGCGTDAGVPFHYHGTLWREMELLRRIGFRNEEVLRCATLNNARIIGIDGDIGSIDEGKFADLTVLERNPLKDISAVREPLMVIKGGRLYFIRKGLDRDNGTGILFINSKDKIR